jgi:GDP-L-fucose synthase
MPAPVFQLTGKRVWVAGHRGMVGSAIVRRLRRENCEVLTVGRDRVDLRRQADVERWVNEARPEAVFLAAGTVGGILANDTRPAEFIYDNLAIAVNVVEAARRANVSKLLYLGSSCVYPRLAPQPIPENALLTGPLESTNQWYAVAKIAGLMLSRAYTRQYGLDFISAMPTNLYGPGDDFDLSSSHVVPALMRKAHMAKLNGGRQIAVWGSGSPRREFLYVDDLADALVFLMQNYSGEHHINIGAGADITIRELAETIIAVVGLDAELQFDTSMPDGTPRKLLDCTMLRAAGWAPRTELRDGLQMTYDWFVRHGDARGLAGEQGGRSAGTDRTGE